MNPGHVRLWILGQMLAALGASATFFLAFWPADGGPVAPPGGMRWLCVSALPLAGCILWMSSARYINGRLIDGAIPVAGEGASLVRSCLTNTAEQTLLHLLAMLAVMDMPGAGRLIPALSVQFVTARVLFVAGYAVDPALRAFGFAFTFYPTLFVLVMRVLA